MNTAPDQYPEQDAVLVTAGNVRARFGNISDMTLWRWMHDPKLDFPQPIIIRRRRFWRLAEIQAFERSRGHAEA